MAVLGAQSVEELKDRVADMRTQLQPGHPLAKKIYGNVFLLSLDPGQKQLGKEVQHLIFLSLVSIFAKVLLSCLKIHVSTRYLYPAAV